jgi:hypothetical protein
LNPYEIADKIDTTKMMKEYAVGKTLSVVKGSEKIGEISNVEFESYYCVAKPRNPKQKILPKIIGAGKYEGKTLAAGKGINKDKSIGVLNILATPTSFLNDNSIKTPILTEDDQKNMINSFRKYILPMAQKMHDKRIGRNGRHVIDEEKGYLFVAAAIDLEGKGRNDFLGIYRSVLRIAEGKISAGSSSIDVPFVLWHNGIIEMLDLADYVPSYNIIGAADIDDDGIKELFIQKIIQIADKREEEPSIDTLQIEILKHMSPGWQSIWQSGLICAPSSFYY